MFRRWCRRTAIQLTWRDAWQVDAAVGQYFISGKPMSAAQ
jgi:hypothetical protein